QPAARAEGLYATAMEDRRDADQTCPLPPSTNSSMPVTKLESSEARNSTAFAISSGSPMRPIGMVDTIRAMASAGCPSIAGVSVGPGLITFERICRSLRSEVQVRTKERTAALVAPYTPKAGVPFTLATEPLRMIE